MLKEDVKITPFNAKSYIPDAYLNDYSYRQLIAFTTARQVLRTMKNIKDNQITPADLQIRDIVFKKSFKEEEQPDLYDFTEVNFKPTKTNDRGMHLQVLREKCQIMKQQFWRKYSTIPPITNEKLETRRIISEIKTDYTLMTQACFLVFTAGVSYFLKLHNNPIKFTLFFAVTSLTLGYNFSIYRNSNRIFNDIPTLPDQEAELQRNKVLNFCYSLDIELVSKYMLYEENYKKRMEEIN